MRASDSTLALVRLHPIDYIMYPKYNRSEYSHWIEPRARLDARTIDVLALYATVDWFVLY
jgi:hypothetical protein